MSTQPKIKPPKNLIRIPIARQSTNYTCGVASVQSILQHFGDEYREDKLAQLLKAGVDWGTGWRDIVEFTKGLGYTVHGKLETTLGEVKKYVDAGTPVMVAFQAWSEPVPEDWTKVTEDGHYSVVIGYDDDNLFFMDPSTLGNYTYIPIKQFMDRWHDSDGRDNSPCNHLSIAITKGKPAYDPDLILPLN